MDPAAQYEALRNRLKLKSLQEKTTFSEKFPHALTIFQKNNFELSKIRQKSAKVLSASTLASVLFLAPPSLAVNLPPASHVAQQGEKNITVKSPQLSFLDKMSHLLPATPQALTRSQEKSLEQIFKDYLQVNSKGTLEGEHLNSTYGLIGAEQRLMRYPGDVQEDMAPGKGAWGYFAPTKAQLTPTLINTEKWYVVVQTLYLPDWNTRTRYLRDWYKYRKVLVVNTVNGNAVVGAIADSGPAAWTGKQFGGSPAVMDSLGGKRYKKGPVVVFFVDDPENKVPLGPIEYNKLNLESVSLKQI